MTNSDYDKEYIDRQICRSCNLYNVCPHTGNINFDRCAETHNKEANKNEKADMQGL